MPSATIISPDLRQYQVAMKVELDRILSYWDEHVQDKIRGGFYGKIDHANKVFDDAPKGSVLNARILWAFAAAYNHNKNEKYKEIAKIAFDYFTEHFIDKQFGGVYWTVDADGKPADTKKQTYAIAFAVYALSEYNKCSGDINAKGKAIFLYQNIIEYTTDKKFNGYFEAFAQDWEPIDDLRLSAKDANEKKSMNTHLHVIEAFANLYKIWPDIQLKEQIKELLELFEKYIINNKTHHLNLFFGEDWSVRSDMISYGHDIEAAWLLQECAEIIGDKAAIEKFKIFAQKIAKAAAEGLDKDGGLWYEYEPAHAKLIKQKHSWPQAEAMIGFFNSWQNTQDQYYLKKSIESWRFIQQHIIDAELGEWVWGVHEDYSVMKEEDKAGLWKCPYHNARACLEIIRRIN